MKKSLFTFFGIQCDALGVSLLISIGLGASPFGLLISSIALLIPIYVGLLSFGYDTLTLGMVSLLEKKRYNFLSLLYGFIFAVFFQLYIYVFSFVGDLSIYILIPLIIVAIGLLDLAKLLLYYGNGPKLSTALLIYAIHSRFNISLNRASKLIIVTIIGVALLISWIAGDPFYQFGFVTILYLIVSGFLLKFLDHKYRESIDS